MSNNFIPVEEIIKEKYQYQRVTLNKTYEEIIKEGITLWCITNVKCRWSILSPSEFLFEDGQEAITFVLKFG